MQAEFFRERLLAWHAANDRPLPWKGEKNPYYIWLSEIILQQTRVEQGLPYFERFKENYPTVEDLAAAPVDEVMKLWEGLGYYSRARNLHTTAKNIAENMGGIFPTTYSEILKLKGVGPYTAAAIASFAYHLPHAVVDGNVYRVLSRTFGISTPIDSTPGKKQFAALAEKCLDKTRPDVYNQAIMDFGATYCTPKSPECQSCVMSEKCTAFRENKVEMLPVKSKKIKKRERYFYYFVISAGDEVLVRKRGAGDIWQGLYEFPLLESDKAAANKNAIEGSEIFYRFIAPEDYTIRRISKSYNRILTHQKISIQFWEIEVDKFKEGYESAGFRPVLREKLASLAFPRTIDLYLSDKSLTLELF